jgi:hypothetical protein
LNANILICEPVASALKAGMPVVALESTIISHGMPYPENLQCAQVRVMRYPSLSSAQSAGAGGGEHCSCSRRDARHDRGTRRKDSRWTDTRSAPQSAHPPKYLRTFRPGRQSEPCVVWAACQARSDGAQNVAEGPL